VLVDEVVVEVLVVALAADEEALVSLDAADELGVASFDELPAAVEEDEAPRASFL
jgi:hypothetical protein